MNSGILYIVATPIGNLEDMTFRAVRILKEVDLIAAEDTRHSRKLLSHYGISTRMTPYHDHNEQLKTDYLLENLLEGRSVALITDAGTPCIADPGYRIVRAAVASGVRVVPIPGAAAFLSALSAAGLETDRFAFEGFLPPKEGKRRSRLAGLVSDNRMLIFYEAPHRLEATLADMHVIFGMRQAVVARELTKIHEEFRHGTLEELAAWYNDKPVKGEVVILVSPPAAPVQTPTASLEELLKEFLLDESLSVKDAVARATAESGISRSEVYEMALMIKKKEISANE